MYAKSPAGKASGVLGMAFVAVVLAMCSTSTWATCSSALSGTTATVTCNQNTDSLTLSQVAGNWYHTGPVIAGSIYDWDSNAAGTQYLAAGGTVQVNFPAGATLHIGNTVTPASALVGAVGITNPASSGTQVYLDAAAATGAAVYTIDDAFGVTGVGQLLFVDSASGGLELIVATGSAADVLYIRSVCSCDTVLVQGTSGNDAVSFGKNGSTQLILGAVTVLNDSGFTTVTVDDHADATARGAIVTSTGITGLAPAPINWNYFDIGSIDLVMGSGDDMVSVRSLENPFGLSSLAIDGTAGHDTVAIANDTLNAQAIKASVSIANSGGFSTVVIHNAADSQPRNAILTPDGISGLAPAPITWVSQGLASVSATVGAAGSILHVLGTPSNPLLPDTFQTTISFVNGDNRCYINGAGLGAHSVTTIAGGGGDDLFVVSAVATSAGLSIYGGSQAVADQLVYTSGAATGAFPGSGLLTPTDPSAAPIYYNSIELFSIHDWIFSSGFE